MQTDRKLRKYPDDGFVQTFEAGEMDRNFAVKGALAVETASITCHWFRLQVYVPVDSRRGAPEDDVTTITPGYIEDHTG